MDAKIRTVAGKSMAVIEVATPVIADHKVRLAFNAECVMKRFELLARMSVVTVGMFVGQAAGVAAEAPWSIEQSHASWTQAQASGDKIAITNVLSLKGGDAGQWTSKWHQWQGDGRCRGGGREGSSSPVHQSDDPGCGQRL